METSMVDKIHDKINCSYLDFSINKTPYSSYITIRKKIQKNFTDEDLKRLDSIENTNTQEKKMHDLLSNNAKLQESLNIKGKEVSSLMKECEDLKLESKKKDVEVENLKKHIKQVEEEKITIEAEHKSSNQALLREHKKDIHDFRKEYTTEIEQLQNKIKELTDFKSKKIIEERERKRKEKKERKKEKKLNKDIESKTVSHIFDGDDGAEITEFGDKECNEKESTSSLKMYTPQADHFNENKQKFSRDGEVSITLPSMKSTIPSMDSSNENTFRNTSDISESAMTSSSSNCLFGASPTIFGSSKGSLTKSTTPTVASSNFLDTFSSEYGFGYPRAAPSIDWDTWPYG